MDLSSPGLASSTFITLPVVFLVCFFLVVLAAAVAAVVVTARATALNDRLQASLEPGDAEGVAPSSPRTPTPTPTPHEVPSAEKGFFPSRTAASSPPPSPATATATTAAAATACARNSPTVLLDNRPQVCTAGDSREAVATVAAEARAVVAVPRLAEDVPGTEVVGGGGGGGGKGGVLADLEGGASLAGSCGGSGVGDGGGAGSGGGGGGRGGGGRSGHRRGGIVGADAGDPVDPRRSPLDDTGKQTATARARAGAVTGASLAEALPAAAASGDTAVPTPAAAQVSSPRVRAIAPFPLPPVAPPAPPPPPLMLPVPVLPQQQMVKVSTPPVAATADQEYSESAAQTRHPFSPEAAERNPLLSPLSLLAASLRESARLEAERGASPAVARTSTWLDPRQSGVLRYERSRRYTVGGFRGI